jgi:dTDP-4-dehydrorhamnose 3,5-epimerase
MRIEPLSFGLFRLTPEPIADNRGLFARSFSRRQLSDAGLVTDFPEWSLSFNRKRGTLRGLHWQAAPHGETKLVQCVRGAIFDVAVDVRPESPSRGRWRALELTAENREIIYIPPGFAHGFQTLTDEAEVYYHISSEFHADLARGVLWSDPDLAISWPDCGERIMSDRDAGLPPLADIGGSI